MREGPPQLNQAPQAPAVPFDQLSQNIAGNVDPAQAGPAISDPTQQGVSFTIAPGAAESGMSISIVPGTEGAFSNPTAANAGGESTATQNDRLANLGNRLGLIARGTWNAGNTLAQGVWSAGNTIARGAWDAGNTVARSESVQRAARFTTYVGKQAVAGALEGSQVVFMDAVNAGETEFDTEAIMHGAKQGALIGGAKAVHRSFRGQA